MPGSLGVLRPSRYLRYNELQIPPLGEASRYGVVGWLPCFMKENQTSIGQSAGLCQHVPEHLCRYLSSTAGSGQQSAVVHTSHRPLIEAGIGPHRRMPALLGPGEAGRVTGGATDFDFGRLRSGILAPVRRTGLQPGG